tara:strand:+ start:28 stop:1842 length:1815 start_codon:yes stop_codon:yes gene_type:complete
MKHLLSLAAIFVNLSLSAQTVSAYQSVSDIQVSGNNLDITTYNSHYVVLENSGHTLVVGDSDPYGAGNIGLPLLSVELASGQMYPSIAMSSSSYSFTATDYYPILIGYDVYASAWKVIQIGMFFNYSIVTTVSITDGSPPTYSVLNGDDAATYTLYYESMSYSAMVNMPYTVTKAPSDAGITTSSGTATGNIGSSMVASGQYQPILVDASGNIVAAGQTESITVPVGFSIDVSAVTPTYSITGGDDLETYSLYYETTLPSYVIGDSYSPAGGALSNVGITTTSSAASGSIAYLPAGTYYGVLVNNIAEVAAIDASGFVISENTTLGFNALGNLTTGATNTAIGANALSSNTEGSHNTSIGRGSLPNNTLGNYNTASGYQSLQSNTEGDNNTASGTSALYSNLTGYRNTAFGENSLYSNTTGVKNTGLGYDAQASSATATNQTIIGFEATGQADNSVVLGNDDVTAVYMAEDRGAKIYAGEGDFSGDIVTAGNVTVSSDIRLKKDIVNLPSTLDNIKSLRPVSYSKKSSLSSEEYGSTEIGLIAQELQEVYPNMVSEDDSKDPLLSVSYMELIPVLIKAVQEQQIMIEKQQMEIEGLKKDIKIAK